MDRRPSAAYCVTFKQSANRENIHVYKLPAGAFTNEEQRMSFHKMKTEATRQWRAWAEQLADGGKPPAVVELLEAGVVLQVSQPMAALEDDANAIIEVRDLELRAQLCRDKIGERTAPFGGAQGVRDRINELRAELRKLEGLVGITALHHQAGTLAGEASRLRAKFPRVFGPIDSKPARKAREEALV